MKSRTLPTVLITLAAALVLAMVGALAFIYSGLYNVAATDSHLGIVRWALNTSQERSVAEHAESVPEPPPLDSAAVVSGFQHFSSMCVVCHGAPGVERGEFGKGLNPTPPALSEKAEEYTPRELFWITKHGIKMAGMPAFGPTHSDEDLWGIVAFVQRLAGMSPQEYQRWVEAYGGDGGGGHGHGGGGQEAGGQGSGSGGGHAHEPGSAPHSH